MTDEKTPFLAVSYLLVFIEQEKIRGSGGHGNPNNISQGMKNELGQSYDESVIYCPQRIGLK